MDIEIIKQKMRERIEVEGLTLSQVARESGISVATLSRFNTNKGVLGYANLKKIQVWLGCTKVEESQVLTTKKISVGDLTFLISVKLIKADFKSEV